MNITKELLSNFDIVSTTLKIDDETIMCVPIRKEGLLWTFSSDKIISKNDKGRLSVDFKTEKIDCICLITAVGENYFECYLNSPDVKIKKFIEELNEIEVNDEKYGRRKEKRIPVNLDNYKELGLSSLEQDLYINTNTVRYPCVLVDVSVHGICFITRYNNSLRDIENFKIKVTFNDIKELVILTAHKVHVKINNMNDKSYATYCCQILDPINFYWKNQIINVLKKFVRS